MASMLSAYCISGWTCRASYNNRVALSYLVATR